MAVTSNIKININTQSAIKSIADLDNELGGTVSTVSDLRMAVESLTEELESTQVGTERFNELKAALIDTTTQLKNYELGIEALDHEQVASEIGSVVGGLTSMVGGLTLLGVSNENVEKIAQTFAKVEGAGRAVVGTIEAYQSAQKLANTFSAMGAKLQTALTAAFTVQTTATEGATVATKTLGIAMKALPIFAIIGAVTALVSAFVSYNQKNEEAAKVEKKRAEELKKTNELQKETTKFIAQESSQFVGLILQLKATNKSSKERSDLIKQINGEYGTTLKNLSDETEFQNQLNLAVDEYIKLQSVKFKIGKNQELIQKGLEKQYVLEKQILAQEKEIQELADSKNISFGEASRNLSLTGQALIKNREELDAVNKRLEGYGLNILKLNNTQDDLTDGGKKYVEQTKETSKVTEKLTKDTDKLTESLIAYYDALESDRQRRITDDREKELQEAANRYDSLTALADAAGQDTATITEQYRKDIQAINLKYDDLARKSEEEKVNERRTTNAALKVLDVELKIQEELNTASTEEEKKKIKQKYANELRDAKIAEIKALSAIELANTKLTEEQREKIITDTNLKIAQLNGEAVDTMAEDTKKTVQDTLNEISQITSQVFGGINDLLGALSESMRLQQEQLAYERDLQYQSEEAALQNLLAQNLISREEYDAKTAEMNQQKAMEERAARRKAFNDEKKLRMASAGMAMAQAIINGLATQPLVPLGIIMAALAAVTGGIQLSNIKNQQFTAARGGVVPGSGPSHIDSVPSMLAPGEMVINSQSASMFPQTLSQINQMGGGIALTPDIPQKTTSGGNQKVYQENKEAQRVYVLETDITRSQKRVTRIEDIASF
jgi:hypothetical protein